MYHREFGATMLVLLNVRVETHVGGVMGLGLSEEEGELPMMGEQKQMGCEHDHAQKQWMAMSDLYFAYVLLGCSKGQVPGMLVERGVVVAVAVMERLVYVEGEVTQLVTLDD